MPRLNPFAGGRTKLSKLWEAAIDGHVVSLAWSNALGLLAAASADGPIALFDAKTGRVRANFSGHGFGTSCVAWTADGQHLASGGQDGKIRLWNPATGEQIKEMPAGAAWVERLAWCPTAEILASAAGKKLRLWDNNGEMLREYPDHPSTIADIAWKPDEMILASTGYGKLFLWSPEQSAALRDFTWQGSMLVLAWSPNGEYIAAGGQDCSVHFWLMKTGEDLQMTGYPRKVREIAWDSTSRYLATGGADISCVWDCSGDGPAGTEPIQLEAHKDFVACLAYQHRGEFLASGGEDGLVALWRPSQQRGAISLAKHAGPVSQLAWSADDQRLAVGTANGAVVMYGV
jgi:WD40 repeat protein